MVTSHDPTFQDPQRVTIQAWTNETSSAAQTTRRVSLASLPPSSATAPSGIRGSTVPLEIPLDKPTIKKSSGKDKEGAPIQDSPATPQKPHREPLRRDSLKRREALLKGKEGSRRRQRWENGRLSPTAFDGRTP